MANIRGSQPGERRGGRKKGTPNKTTKALKDAILLAAEEAGFDGQGQDGLVGYCKALAVNEPKAFCALLGRVLPLQVTGEDGGALRIETVIIDSAEQMGDGA
jgi:hypothetical protein